MSIPIAVLTGFLFGIIFLVVFVLWLDKSGTLDKIEGKLADRNANINMEIGRLLIKARKMLMKAVEKKCIFCGGEKDHHKDGCEYTEFIVEADKFGDSL